MFNAPEIITSINDIAQIYRINDAQCDDLDKAVDEMDGNLFLDRMDEDTIRKWEEILSISPDKSDTLDDRRNVIKTKVISPTRSTSRGVKKLITARLGDDRFHVNIAYPEVEILLHKDHRNRQNDVNELLEEILPLDLIYATNVHTNEYSYLGNYTHEQLSMHTHEQLEYF